MRYTVSAASTGTLRFNETDRVASILQNITMILSTRKGSVPLYRDFGLPMDFVDRPGANFRTESRIPIDRMPYAINTHTPEDIAVREAVEEWEPRATVLGVTFDQSAEQAGKLIPVVEVEISSE